MNWIDQLAGFAVGGEVVARAVIAAVSGPTPRSEGTSMLVSARSHEGRIGRPEAMASVLEAARALIARRQAAKSAMPWLRDRVVMATGPVLGETTGGEIIVLIEAFGPREIEYLLGLAGTHRILARAFEDGVAPVGQGDQGNVVAVSAAGTVTEPIELRARHFHVYGTGLAAQALVRLLAGLPFEVHWHDWAPSHFPADALSGVLIDQRYDPVAAARDSEAGSYHAVMTSDHALDLAICRAVVAGAGFGYLGVIGSRVKRERLLARLQEAGVAGSVLARISCPMGLAGIRSKDPRVMALSIAAEAMTLLEAQAHTASGSKA